MPRDARNSWNTKDFPPIKKIYLCVVTKDFVSWVGELKRKAGRMEQKADFICSFVNSCEFLKGFQGLILKLRIQSEKPRDSVLTQN